jgi:hypothetical protein
VKPIRYAELRAFCRIDGWTCSSDKPGRTTKKHEVWMKSLPSGSTLRVVISKGRGEYPPELVAHILKHELRVTESEFWSAVRTGEAPPRPDEQPPQPEGELLPLSLVRALVAAGYSPAELSGLSLAEAKKLLKRR